MTDRRGVDGFTQFHLGGFCNKETENKILYHKKLKHFFMIEIAVTFYGQVLAWHMKDIGRSSHCSKIPADQSPHFPLVLFNREANTDKYEMGFHYFDLGYPFFSFKKEY